MYYAGGFRLVPVCYDNYDEHCLLGFGVTGRRHGDRESAEESVLNCIRIHGDSMSYVGQLESVELDRRLEVDNLSTRVGNFRIASVVITVLTVSAGGPFISLRASKRVVAAWIAALW